LKNTILVLAVSLLPTLAMAGGEMQADSGGCAAAGIGFIILVVMLCIATIVTSPDGEKKS
jgi:hypothetical protein